MDGVHGGVMVRMSHMQRRLSMLFVALSLALWVAKLCLHEEPADHQCKVVSEISPGKWRHARKWVDHQAGPRGKDAAQSPAQWLQNRLQYLSPTHFSVYSSCPALNASIALPSGVPDYAPQGESYLGTVSVLGTLHLRLDPADQQNQQNASKISQWLGGVFNVIRDSDYILAEFPTLIRRTDSLEQSLSVLSSLGPSLVLSLANTKLATQTSGEAVMNTVRAMEGAGIEWLGTHAKRSHILRMGKERVGVLAFCGVHKECGSGSILHFSPVKYSAKAAKSAVNELKQHGVRVVLVLMYWGIENSYFPDEMALTVARQLALLGVSAVLGDHPNAVQDHAYFGNTLVVFSAGKLLSSTKVTNYCWKKISVGWKYSTTKACSTIHPNAREGLFQREMETRIYRLHLSWNQPVTAEYTTIKLEDLDEGSEYSIRRPGTISNTTWTAVCSDNDAHCLACQPF